MSDEMRIGRALLIESGKAGLVPAVGSPENRQMTHALGGLETAAIFIGQRHISLDQFISVWHHNLRAMRDGADLLAKQRMEDLEGWWPWPRLWPLFDAAAGFRDDKLLCCRHEGRWPHRLTQPLDDGLCLRRAEVHHSGRRMIGLGRSSTT